MIIDEKSIGNKLRQARVNKQLSQQDVANITNFDRSVISRIESGKRHLKVCHVACFSEVYDVDLNALFDVDSDSVDFL